MVIMVIMLMIIVYDNNGDVIDDNVGDNNLW